MKITIITVCWNAERTIVDAMRSVAGQRLDDGRTELEYIVLDGDSKDGTVDRIREFEAIASQARRKHSFTFRWLSEKDHGMYDAMNRGIEMATGDVIGICNADDVLAGDEVVENIAMAFEESPDRLDCVYADIRFVDRDAAGVEGLRKAKTRRYCTGKWFRRWMFRFGTQVAHPSFFCRKECFERLGAYSMKYGMYGDFELLLRFLWKARISMRYLPMCTHVMRLDGASTGSFAKTVLINGSNLRALRDNGCHSNLLLLYSRYLLKVWGFVFRRQSS